MSSGLFAYTENKDSYVGTVYALSAIAVPTLMTYLALMFRKKSVRKV